MYLIDYLLFPVFWLGDRVCSQIDQSAARWIARKGAH